MSREIYPKHKKTYRMQSRTKQRGVWTPHPDHSWLKELSQENTWKNFYINLDLCESYSLGLALGLLYNIFPFFLTNRNDIYCKISKKFKMYKVESTLSWDVIPKSTTVHSWVYILLEFSLYIKTHTSNFYIHTIYILL